MSDPRDGHLKLLYEHKASIPNGGLYPPDWLFPCPTCGKDAPTDSGHRICWDCEGIRHLRGGGSQT